MIRVGLTGGVASGKTTVLRFFRERGSPTFSADSIVRRLYRPPGPFLKKISRLVGPGSLSQTGRLRRAAVARAVFSDAQLKKKLEDLVHPAVVREISRHFRGLEKKGVPIVVVEVPLLFEAGLAHHFDRIIVVSAPLRTQVARVMKRFRVNRAEALRRVRAQIPLPVKIRRADDVIPGSGPLARTRARTISVWNALNHDAGRPRDRGRRRGGAAAGGLRRRG